MKITEKEKFLSWLAIEREKGLIDINIFPSDSAGGATEEEIYGELNRMNEAPDIPESNDFF